MSEVLQHMIEALRIEVAAIRKQGGGTQIALQGGERVDKIEGSWLYRFFVVEDINLRDDTPVRVTCGQEDVSGVLVSFRDGVLIVALEKDMGPKIPAARLVTDDSFLLERLKQRLEDVSKGAVPFNREAADRVLGLSPLRTADADPDPAVIKGSDRPNTDQLHAIRRSLGSETTYVWGPPGTGKTTTLARIVEAHYRVGRSVLLVSNTNIAVDTALERVAERLMHEPDFDRGLVIRQGPVIKPELRTKFGSHVVLEEIAARLGRPLRDEKERLAGDAARLEMEESSLATALSALERLSQTQRELAGQERTLAGARSKAAAISQETKEHRRRVTILRANLERARTMGLLRRLLSGLNPERLQQELTTERQAVQTGEDEARALTVDISRREADIKLLRAKLDALIASTSAYPAAPEIKSRLSVLRARLGMIRERIAAIDRELAVLEQQVLARCRVLATTVYRTYLGKAKPRQFDVVVVDEASMLMPPLVYYAAGLGTHSVTVAGDFRQLPPIVMSDEPLAVEWLKQDVFEKARIPGQLARPGSIPYLVALATQYRMREPICAVVNDLFYRDHPLRSDPSVASDAGEFPLGASPLLYVDTSPFHPWTAFRLGTYSRYNLFHALLMRKIVLHLAETGFLPRAPKSNDAVGAISPYSAQARLVHALLEARLGARDAGLAATVHRFQGNEKKAILLDLTDSYGAPLSRFLRAVKVEEDGARLLNVAVSRARHHVVLFGNFEYLRAKTPRDGIVRELLNYFEKNGEALQLDEILPLAERDWVDGLHSMFPGSLDFPEDAGGVFTEGTFYPAFLTDIGRARKSIVILSPFITARATGRWADPLRLALSRGVRVRIVTRPPDEAGVGTTEEVREVVDSLRRLGVAVDLRARMHEKVAILDDRVLWHGSLNILSHRDTHETMLRIASPAACSLIDSFVSAPTRHRSDTRKLHDNENPECPNCAGPTVWYNGRYGIYFKCENPQCDGKVNLRGTWRGRPPASDERGNTHQLSSDRRSGLRHKGDARPCPKDGCGGHVVQRNGRHGPFLGCTNYPRCGYTENV